MGSRTAALVAAGALAIGGLAGGSARVAAAAMVADHAVYDDFDGDGVSDLAIGKGWTRVLYLRYSSATVDGSHVAYPRLPGRGYIEDWRTLEPGDYNGDGVEDLAVGEPAHDPVGAVFVFLGHQGSGLDPEPATTLYGPTSELHGFEQWEFGLHLMAADADGDGRDDLAVARDVLDGDGDPMHGVVRIFRGSESGLSTENPLHIQGGGTPLPVALADVDGDGRVDFIAKNYDAYRPQLLVYAGIDGGFATEPERLLGGSEPFGYTGNAFLGVDAAGDINRDGFADVVLNAGYVKRGGAVMVLFGGRHGLSVDHRQVIYESDVYPRAASDTVDDSDAFGADAVIGQVIGSEYPEVVVSSSQPVGGRDGAGAVYVLHGSADGLTVAHSKRITARSPGVPGKPRVNALFGRPLRVADFTGDGIDDLVIGAPGPSSGTGAYAVQRGSVIGMRGSATDPLAHSFLRLVGPRPHMQFGVTIA